MPNTFREADRDNWDIYRTVNPIIQSWLGVTGKGVALTNTQVSDADKYAVDAANAGTGTKALRAVAGAHSLTVNSAGITLSSLTLTGNVTVGGTLTVTGATTLSSTLAVTGAVTMSSTLAVAGASTLAGVTAGAISASSLATSAGVVVGTSLSVATTSTLSGAVTCQSSLQVNGAVQMGDADADLHYILGKVRVQNAAGTQIPLFADGPNNRVIVGGDTALGSDTTPALHVRGRLYVAPDSANDTAVQIRRSVSATVGWTLGVENSPVNLAFKDDSDTKVFALGDAAHTYQAMVTGDFHVSDNAVIARDLSSDRMAVAATAWISTEKLYVAGNILTANTYGLYGRNQAGSALRNLISKDASDITEIGDANDNTVYVRAGDLVGFLLAGDFELRVSAGGSQFGSPTGGYKGAGTVNAEAVYDDNVLLSDAINDLYFDGKVLPEDEGRWGNERLYSIDETYEFVKEHRHLPSLPGRREWERRDRSLGEMTSAFWQTIERLQLHVFDINTRIKCLESRDA